MPRRYKKDKELRRKILKRNQEILKRLKLLVETRRTRTKNERKHEMEPLDVEKGDEHISNSNEISNAPLQNDISIGDCEEGATQIYKNAKTKNEEDEEPKKTENGLLTVSKQHDYEPPSKEKEDMEHTAAQENGREINVHKKTNKNKEHKEKDDIENTAAQENGRDIITNKNKEHKEKDDMEHTAAQENGRNIKVHKKTKRKKEHKEKDDIENTAAQENGRDIKVHKKTKRKKEHKEKDDMEHTAAQENGRDIKVQKKTKRKKEHKETAAQGKIMKIADNYRKKLEEEKAKTDLLTVRKSHENKVDKDYKHASLKAVEDVYTEGSPVDKEYKHASLEAVEDVYTDGSPVKTQEETKTKIAKEKEMEYTVEQACPISVEVKDIDRKIMAEKQFKTILSKFKRKQKEKQVEREDEQVCGKTSESVDPVGRAMKTHKNPKVKKEQKGKYIDNHEEDLKEKYIKRKLKKLKAESRHGSVGECRQDSENRDFDIIISQESWKNVSPEVKTYGGKAKVCRRLKGKWTVVFSDKVAEIHQGCALAFKSHNVKKAESRKLGSPFLTAVAFCSGIVCQAKYTFRMQFEPMEDQEQIAIQCSVEGVIKHHKNEICRRSVVGQKRIDVAQEIVKTGSVNVHYDNLLKGNTDQLAKGNYSSVPTPNVLRKLVSEQLKKEQYHSNTMAEVQLLKEAYDTVDEPFIRDIGLDPFFITMFSNEQIELFRKHGRATTLHIDATGGIIMKIANQKTPYLYSLVMQPNSTLPPVSVAEMISTQHTVPKIEFFLQAFLRESKLQGRPTEIRQVETDYSFAIIQAVLKAFNGLEVKSYLRKCFQQLTEKSSQVATVLHLCTAHMIQDYIRQLKKFCPTMTRQTKLFALRTFAILQNVKTIEESKDIFRDICCIFLSNSLSGCVEESLLRLEQRMSGIEDQENCDLDEESTEIFEQEQTEDSTTIRSSSLFNKIYRIIVGDFSEVTSSCTQINDLYCPQAITCLLDRFMYLIPLWSGMMLEEGKTRSSNAAVESWFKVLKKDVLKSRRGLRPATLVIYLRKTVLGHIRELVFTGARKPKSKRRTKLSDISVHEEFWSRKPQKKKSYQPPKRQIKGHEDFPIVSKWGGDVQGQALLNTCTIDNGLTILHLCVRDRPDLQEKLATVNNELFSTLLCVFSQMNEERFTEAKLLWINFTQLSSPARDVHDLHGDESDYFFGFFDPEWRSRIISTCSGENCSQPYRESGEIQGITVSLPSPVKGCQEILDRWMLSRETCWASFTESSGESRCHAQRKMERRVTATSPFLILRVAEHCISGRIDFPRIAAVGEVNMNDKRYELVGCTMHKTNHFCAVVFSKKFGQLWYDGLVGHLQPISSVKHINRWIPCHVLYCEESNH